MNAFANTVISASAPPRELAYDHQSRMGWKNAFEISNNYKLETKNCAWGGWNLIQETITPAVGSITTNRYHWGVDLSGTLQGAGGVGGLLAVSVDGQYHLPCYDHNGNVTAYISESGIPSAQYLYDAFGNTLEQSGAMADTFRFRFSTKYFVPETRSYYYGYRFYLPELGRWLNRDPIEEGGGLNLYGFVKNNPVTRWDVLGLRGDSIEDKRECDRCGPEVDSGLAATMERAQQQFGALLPEQKTQACSLSHLYGSWDIYFPDPPKGCGAGQCADTVMVGGKCYDKWKVNYILFGRIMSLCDRWRVTMEALVAAQKLIRKPLVDGDWEYEYTTDVRGFARIGYGWNGSWPSSLPDSTGGKDKCKKCDAPGAKDAKYGRAFAINWP